MQSSDPAQIINLIQILIGPNGCPWDKEQTPESLCDYLAEECFELIDAIRSKNLIDIQEELGDVFFLLFFIAVLLENQGISLNETWKQNAAKMTGRHPHVFGDQKIQNHAELIAVWEEVKKQEKNAKGQSNGLYASLPSSLPPLLKAYRIHSKAAKIGFTWPDNADVKTKLNEELAEFEQACFAQNPDQMEEEFGDLLFTLVELGRRKGLKANAALARANQKFLKRVQTMEKLTKKSGTDFQDLNFAEMDKLWNQVKDQEKGCS